MACLTYLLIYIGTMIQNNMVLFTREAVGMAEDTFVGYQLAIRFGTPPRAQRRLRLLSSGHDFVETMGVNWLHHTVYIH